MVVGAEGCSPLERGWGTVRRHKEHTAHRQALRVGGSEHTAQRDGEQPRHGLGRTAGMGGFILASCGAGGLWFPRAAPLCHVKHPAPASCQRPWLALAPWVAPVLAMACHRGHQAHPSSPIGGACGAALRFWGRPGRAHGCRTKVGVWGAGLGVRAARQSRAAEMWPVCAWAALGVGEKEGEEAAEAAAPLISSFLNTFRPWCQTDTRGA